MCKSDQDIRPFIGPPLLPKGRSYLLDFGADLVVFILAIKLSILECKKLQESNQIQPKAKCCYFCMFAYYSIIIMFAVILFVPSFFLCFSWGGGVG
jgi:hypothetical protein